jgi:succinate-semialdehyde dehydrogenase/glutarate-semialdehyde dehydrogenase
MQKAAWPERVTPQLLDDLKTALPMVPGAQRKQIAIDSPATGEIIGHTPACSVEDLDRAFALARTAQQRWATSPLSERRRIFLRYHDLVLDQQELLLDLLQLETGKARRHALEEVLDVAIVSRYYALRLEKYLKPKRRRGALPVLTKSTEYHHPLGVVGIISPWNYPLSLAVSDAVAAVMAGNAVILKPDSQTPFIALLAVKLLVQAGLPADLFQIVTGFGRELGGPLISGSDFLCFTGSTVTGRVVAAQAGENLIKCSLELGGKNPVLVLDDADIERTVEGLVRGCFSNAGQLCISFERLYLQSGIHDRFLAAFSERVKRLQLGHSYDYQPEIGSLISAAQLATVQEHLKDALNKGATVLAGGKHRPDIGPYFFEPTLLSGVTEEMTLCREETFGPVVSVYRFERIEEALKLANDSEYGLNTAVWTRSTARGENLASKIQCGTANINEAYAAAWASVDAPMGGMKGSGLSRRHGSEGILKYTESQNIAIQRLLPVGPLPGIPVASYARIMTIALRLLRRIPGLG